MAKRRKDISEIMISVAQLRKLFIETELPAQVEENAKQMAARHPLNPPLPKGVPQNFMEALFTPGVCAIPLWNPDLKRWRFIGICDGGKIENANGLLMFDTYDEAMTQLRGWYEWKNSHGHSRRTA